MGTYSHTANFGIQNAGELTVGVTQVDIRVDKPSMTEVRIQASYDNSGTVYIGSIGVTTTSYFIWLGPGDEVTFDYNDIKNPIYAISDAADQRINLGFLKAITI